uniref:Uncharacterized protein n=1 Tax=uncultured bacterium 888 TaxID=548896 RepID=B8R8R1_9BACT|nr:hypothetical protein [uncultured bacterium 888]
MQNVYDDPKEQSLHKSVIESLAAELHRPIDEVRGVYEDEMVRLKTDAKVKTFLAVLAARCTRERVHGSRHG